MDASVLLLEGSPPTIVIFRSYFTLYGLTKFTNPSQINLFFTGSVGLTGSGIVSSQKAIYIGNIFNTCMSIGQIATLGGIGVGTIVALYVLLNVQSSLPG